MNVREMSYFRLQDSCLKLLMVFFQNCINQFTATAQNARCSFIGNVNVGKDVKVKELLHSYDAVVLVC